MALAQLFLRDVYDYDIEDAKVRVLLFRLVPVMTIRISNIRDISECSPTELWKPTFALKFGNRVWARCVLIRKRRGLIRSVVITLGNPHEFAEQIKEIQRKQADIFRSG
ncbi:MAG: hypothetical protein IVW54_15005 [Candidatus Binataceae bacterium]|nr:hypothetical protein [Candidatus Binataceae bacterium]